MAQHGYLHDTYDSDGFDREDDRERGSDRERGWEGRDERSWRGRDSGWTERDAERDSMFGWRDNQRHSGRDDDRGFFGSVRETASSWFGDDDDRHSRHGRSQSHDWNRGNSEGQSGNRYSAHPDDHYRSWRDKQMQALDRDYQDYCREREQQFHQDFDSWRSNRQLQMSGSHQGSQQSGSSEEVMELDDPAVQGGDIPGATTSPMGAATLGTNNSENTASASSATGRGRR